MLEVHPSLLHNSLYPPSACSEVLLAPEEPRATVSPRRPFVTLEVKGMPKNSGTAEEHPAIGLRVLVANAGEDSIPIWPAIMGWSTQSGQSVSFSTDVGKDNIVHVVFLHLARHVSVNLDVVV